MGTHEKKITFPIWEPIQSCYPGEGDALFLPSSSLKNNDQETVKQKGGELMV